MESSENAEQLVNVRLRTPLTGDSFDEILHSDKHRFLRAEPTFVNFTKSSEIISGVTGRSDFSEECNSYLGNSKSSQIGLHLKYTIESPFFRF